MPKINSRVLVSGADYFTDKDAINALMDSSVLVDQEKAKLEHQTIVQAFKQAGIKVLQVDPPKDCQDGVYTANWGLVRNGLVLASRLPEQRKPEEPYAKQIFSELGLKILELPQNITAFSGQGDCIVVDDWLFCHSPYRTAAQAHPLVKELLGYKHLIELRTKPKRWFKIGPAKRNKLTGWPDSPTYDLDLSLALVRPGSKTTKPLIAYCPEVFKLSSRRTLKALSAFDKILVSKSEALSAYVLNLVSTGETVIINSGAPLFKQQLIDHGLKVVELDLTELKKGGGSIRCSSLTLD